MFDDTARESNSEYETRIPVLNSGDVLDSDEFLRRYAASPGNVCAERINGRVYLMSPLRAASHGDPHALLATWLGTFAAQCGGVILSDNATVRLDAHNDPQPDLCLRREDGNARIIDGYIVGPPELIVEVASSSASYDLGEKRSVYENAGVLEYLVFETERQQLTWWKLGSGGYFEIAIADGVLKSDEFPGLWLDVAAISSGDGRRLLETLA